MNSKYLIEATDLTKEFRIARHKGGTLGALKGLFSREYDRVLAVDGISFGIAQGELVGYLGPNGAGKSTTIKMLVGIIVPSGGSLRVGGLDPSRDRVRHVADLGVVFGQRSNLWWDLPVIESLQLMRHIYKVPHGDYLKAMKDFDDLLDLGEFINTPVRSLSLGQRMRADIAAALIHNPKVLFLDEPTIGLDIVAKERVRQFIGHINREKGTTVILTTHDLEDINRLCQRVIMIDHGRVVYDGALPTLVERFGGPRQLVVEFARDYGEISLPGATIAERDRLRITFNLDSSGLPGVMAELSTKYEWFDLSLKEPGVEATIMRVYENGISA